MGISSKIELLNNLMADIGSINTSCDSDGNAYYLIQDADKFMRIVKSLHKKVNAKCVNKLSEPYILFEVRNGKQIFKSTMSDYKFRKIMEGNGMYYSGDPQTDADMYFNNCEEWLEKRPICKCCGEHIQEEQLYAIGDESYCSRCVDVVDTVERMN